ncbi:hypothetical protein EMA8858_00248 [Emticicia aquatica]|jgi:hypothetical protein|uniref:TonB C-terminal domain-containing protein n=1 Tax=Emticicia aquatica TaxID=1681835 RepID=A0ABM9ALL8_9BACT|nr:hypothetical protein [Emticicia aquatica]CAH0994141.1 hypothetical protein EMA8858_00248 [Emticicia aquatica]
MYAQFTQNIKLHFVYIGIFISAHCVAQKDLDRNPVFFELAKKHISYPKNAILSSLYGRIYVKFFVNRVGKIEDIEVFYPLMTPQFEQNLNFGGNIKKGLKKLPLLGLGYEGEYILPIAFVFTNYSESSAVVYPTNTLPDFIEIGNKTILTEIQIFGKSNRYSYFRPQSGFETSPPSWQIVE